MNPFTVIHVVISLVGIFTGFVVAFDLLASRFRCDWTAVFLWTTLATSVSGFLFHYHGFTPAIGVGVVSLVVLALGFYALNARKLAGTWRLIYVSAVVVALYLNFFVLIVQSFMKIPGLHALAPTQHEPPFAIAQGIAFLGFVVLGIFACRKFRPVLKPV